MLATNWKSLTVLFAFHHVAPPASEASHSLNQVSKAGPIQKLLYYSTAFGVARHLEKAWTVVPNAPQPLKSSTTHWQLFRWQHFSMFFYTEKSYTKTNCLTQTTDVVTESGLHSRVSKYSNSLAVCQKSRTAKNILQNKTTSFRVHPIRSHVLTILHVHTNCMWNQPFQTTLYFGKSQ